MKFDYASDYFPPIPVLLVFLGYPGDALRLGPVAAIIDTGADGTIAPQILLDEIGAPLVGQVRIRSQWGEWRTMQVFTIDLGLGELRLPAIEVVGDPGSELVLGRNVLNDLRLMLDGPAGQVTLEYH